MSIGVPTYNRADDLAQCLCDLSAQSFLDLEILVADNASGDPRVCEVLRQAQSNDPRIRVVRHGSNIGPVLNFQFVFEQSQGEYFCWVADDDRRSPEFISELVSLLDASPDALLAFCEFEEFPSRINDRGDRALQLRSVLQIMAHPSRWRRLIGFFLAPEGLSKPHPLYGLYRRKRMIGFSLPLFMKRAGWHGADSLLVFDFLSQGRMALSGRNLLAFRLDGLKHHETMSSAGAGLARHFAGVSRLCGYASRYVLIAPASVAPIILLLLPLKWAEILYIHLLRPTLCIIARRLSKDASSGRSAP